MRKPRNISGIYFRFHNPETGTWENWCFEDLPAEKQLEIIRSNNGQWHESMILGLAGTLKLVGDQCDIVVDEIRP